MPDLYYRLPLGGITDARTLTTMARLIVSRWGHRSATPMFSAQQLRRRLEQALESSGHRGQVFSAALRQKDGWVDTATVVRRGDRIVVVASGMLWGAQRLGVGIGPGTALWLRIGDNPVISMLGSGMVIDADNDGPLRVLAAEPGVLDELGEFDPTIRRTPLSGALTVALIHPYSAPDRLEELADIDPELFTQLAHRAAHPTGPPDGWRYHPRLGAAEIFRATGPDEIDCTTHGDVGIVRRRVDHAITDDLHMSWSWLVTSLPSTLPENIEPTHDYLSVAIEFDDGRDLTWMWSSTLDVGTVFGCPLAYWRARETHMVIRSSTTELGQWVDERRNIADDIHTALTPPYPTHVTAIWLIANSTFQRGTGTARYRALQLGSSIPDKEHI
ncbi:DUF3047 domain-containing protein [Nocardia terpenica]|uniref:DUF3047 domain-containing protein n=1 Tax=Nocardia terpenica TaxID=455432 RepID=A0A6G9Z8S6_9NOCA|nr:DUF3047 domain-containing protein [Nocardia terpenica]QIS21413.1 DUF3047 domain-containing protein [Nocardia terpenica]